MLKQLLSLAWPIMVSRSTQSVVTICDAILVSHLGTSALAAASAGGFNSYTFMMLPFGVMFIVSSFSSQYFGQGDLAGARRYGWYGLAVAGMTEVLVLALLPFIPRMLGWFDYTPEVRELMSGYLQIRLLSAGAAVGMEALGNYYGGIGNTRLPMVASVFAMTINVFLCVMLIPRMGVSGAATGNAIATGLAFLLLFGFFFFQKAPPVRLQWGELWRMLRFGLPSGFNWLLEFLAFSFFINVAVTSLGTSALAAMMAVFDMNSVSFMPAFGLASAGAILVGQQIGAREHDRVPNTVTLTLKATLLWQGAAGLLYFFAPDLLLTFFIQTGPDVHEFVAIAKRTLMMASIWQAADATLTTHAEALRAAGDTTYPLVSRLVIAWAMFVPGVLITVHVFHGGDVAASAWIVGYLFLAALLLVRRFRMGQWRSIDLTGRMPT